MAEIVVAGSGQCGLLAAAAICESGKAVTLVERLPALGGPGAGARYYRAARGRGTRSRSEVDARHAGGPVGLRRSSYAGSRRGRHYGPADVLVVATGTRPATRGELGIAGDRFAGILPGSAALHLTESGVLLGRRPVVLGGGSLAASCVHALGHAGADQITVVAPDGIVHPGIREADQVLSGWNVAAALGDPRLDAVTLVAGTSRLQITADALILAHRRVAMRNIEQATDPTPGVVFCHSRADPKSLDDARTTGRDR